MAGPESEAGKPKPEAPKTAAGGKAAASYVGTPAVGTSKAAAAAGLATVGPEPSQLNQGARPIACLSSTLVALIWAVRLTGKPARTSSSARATAAVTTARVSTSKDPRRAPWIVRMSRWLPMARSSWILPGSISGPRDNPATSAIQDHFCRSNHAPAVGAGLAPPASSSN